MATNISKLETLLRERGYNIYCSPIFNPPRTPLDVPVIKNIGEKGIKCSGAFYVPERTRLFDWCGSCPAYSPDIKSRERKVKNNNLRFEE